MNSIALCRSFASLTLCLIALVTGCVSGPESAAGRKKNALTFTPPADKAGLYVIRVADGDLGAGTLLDLMLDDKEVATLKVNSYMHGTIAPGQHALGVKSHGTATKISVESGKNYFFKIVPGWADLQIVQIPGEQGRAYAERYDISVLNNLPVESAAASGK